MNATLFEKLNFDFIRDTAPVASINRIPLVLEVPNSFPTKTGNSLHQPRRLPIPTELAAETKRPPRGGPLELSI